VSPPLDLADIRRRWAPVLAYPGKLEVASWRDISALLARLDEAEELVRALEFYAGFHQHDKRARDALTRWRGTP
jgi:hypothetical protein